MRATEIIRGLLDLIDGVDAVQQPETGCGCSDDCGCGDDDDHTVMAVATTDDELRRFKQILGLVGDDAPEQYSNSPDERVAPVSSVTVDAGGGANSPKHPADIRGEHPSLYPGQVWGDDR
jgi:hypothetical protein